MSERAENSREVEERFAKNRELIERAQGGDEGAMEELVRENTGLVRSIALKFRDRGCDTEDLIQIGMLGMVKAIRSFDLSRNTAFSTYAVPLIVGEIRRDLRDGGPIRVSRVYKKNAAMLMREKHRIMVEEGREATLFELASLCGLTPEEASVSLDALSPVSSFGDTVGEDGTLTYESVIPDENSAQEFENTINKLALAQSIAKMQETWRKIVLLRYYRNLTQQEVADRLGMTQVKVSREEKKLLAFLRTEMGG